MSFKVVVRQRPEGMEAHLATAEMSNDTLQLKLIKDLPNVMSINAVPLTILQKRRLRGLGTAWQMIDLQGGTNDAALVTIKREGHLRKVQINADGTGRYLDGHGDRVQVPMLDPLDKTGWTGA